MAADSVPGTIQVKDPKNRATIELPKTSVSHPIRATFVRRTFTRALYQAACTRLLRPLFKRNGNIILVSSSLCIKATHWTRLAEASTMEFIRNNTDIPVPKVHCAFERKGRCYILMERLPGAHIAFCWAARSEASKASLLEQLRTMIAQMRELKQPTISKTEVSNVDGGPIMDIRLPRKSLWGPFKNVRDFQHELTDGLDLENARGDCPPGVRELGRFHAQQADTEAKFTHGDLSSFNIMVKGDQVTGIVDWETAGWLPWYWEYVSAWYVNPHNEFWQDHVDKFLSPDLEAQKMGEVRLRWFGDF